MTDLQKRIIRLLQVNGNMSRKALVEKLEVTPAAMSQNTKSLIDSNILEECFSVQSDRAGRKEVLLGIKKDAFYSLGIDIDEQIIVSICNAIGNSDSYKTFSSLYEAYNYICNLDLKKCVAIALSKKGFYNLDNLDSISKEFLYKIKNLGIPTTIDNNVACLAYAYKFYNDFDENFILIKYGPGVGSACVIQNKLLKNEMYPTFEIGKLLADYEGNTLESVISYSALGINPNDPIKDLNTNLNLKEKLFKYLCFAIANTNTLLQLNRIILSGEIFQDEGIYLELVDYVNRYKELDKNRITLINNYKEFNKTKASVTALYHSLL